MPQMQKEVRAKKKLLFIEALKQTNGIIYAASQIVKINRSTYGKWYKEDEAFRNKCREVQEETLDKVEGKLLSLIDAKDTTAIIFYLKTKGKSRGYIERQELTGKDGESLLSHMTDEELESKVKHLMEVVNEGNRK